MKALKFIVPLLAVASLTGCAGTSVTEYNVIKLGAVQTTTNNKIKLSCQKLDGTLVYSFSVNNPSVPFTGTVKDELGALTITIEDSDKNRYYNNIIIDNESIELNLANKGRYKMTIVADAFKGSYEFNWK